MSFISSKDIKRHVGSRFKETAKPKEPILGLGMVATITTGSGPSGSVKTITIRDKKNIKHAARVYAEEAADYYFNTNPKYKSGKVDRKLYAEVRKSIEKEAVESLTKMIQKKDFYSEKKIKFSK